MSNNTSTKTPSTMWDAAATADPVLEKLREKATVVVSSESIEQRAAAAKARVQASLAPYAETVNSEGLKKNIR